MATTTTPSDPITNSIGPSTAEVCYRVAALIFIGGVAILGLWLAATLPGEGQLAERVLIAVGSVSSAAYLSWLHLQELTQRVSRIGIRQLTVHGFREFPWLDVAHISRRGPIFILRTRSGETVIVDPRRFSQPADVTHLVSEGVLHAA